MVGPHFKILDPPMQLFPLLFCSDAFRRTICVAMYTVHHKVGNKNVHFTLIFDRYDLWKEFYCGVYKRVVEIGILDLLAAVCDHTRYILICLQAVPGKNPEIYSLHVTSNITFRFATTHVTSQLANRAQVANEIEFRVTLPKAAFITAFSM